MNGNKLVSIITPTYNSEKYIEDCIKSILSQTYTNFEHIIIDGGSTDNTLRIIEKYQTKYRITVISEQDNGMYDAINKGIKLSNGDIISWLNSDDMYFPWALEIVVKAISRYDLKWVTGIPGGWTENGVFYLNKYRKPVYSRNLIKYGLYHGRGLGFIQQESTFWTRELWLKIEDNFLSKYRLAGDFFLWKEMAKHENLVTLEVFLSGFRTHSGQLSGDIASYYKEIGGNYNIVVYCIWILNKLININFFIKIFNKKNSLNCREFTGQKNKNMLKKIQNIIPRNR